jgi:prefoldin subunit 5
MSENNLPIDLNTADIKTLKSLPGIGTKLAKRIRAAQPYNTVDDLGRVDGISSTLLEQLRPMLVISPTEPTETPAEPEVAIAPEEIATEINAPPGVPASEPEVEIPHEEVVVEPPVQPSEPAARPEVEIPHEKMVVEPLVQPSDVSAGPEVEISQEQTVSEPPAQVAKPPAGPKPEPIEPAPEASRGVPAPQPALVTRGQAIFWILVSNFFVLLLSLALSLGILASLNKGRLQYVLPSQHITLSLKVDSLENQVNSLNQDLNSLRARVDNLETLGNRVSNVEKVTGALQKDLNTTRGQLDSLVAQVKETQSRLADIQTQIGSFQAFFKNLRDLINHAFPPEGQP